MWRAVVFFFLFTLICLNGKAKRFRRNSVRFIRERATVNLFFFQSNQFRKTKINENKPKIYLYTEKNHLYTLRTLLKAIFYLAPQKIDEINFVKFVYEWITKCVCSFAAQMLSYFVQIVCKLQWHFVEYTNRSSKSQNQRHFRKDLYILRHHFNYKWQIYFFSVCIEMCAYNYVYVVSCADCFQRSTFDAIKKYSRLMNEIRGLYINVSKYEISIGI